MGAIARHAKACNGSLEECLIGTMRTMSSRSYILISAVIFSLVALAHLVRAVLGWGLVINGWQVPMWPSWLALVVLAGLIVWALGLMRQSR
jgi:hypothetical protein